jgi:hypothetical protein
VARAIADIGVAEGGRAYRVVVGAHPRPGSKTPASPRRSQEDRQRSPR